MAVTSMCIMDLDISTHNINCMQIGENIPSRIVIASLMEMHINYIVFLSKQFLTDSLFYS